jgi:hypothetical protein
MLPLAVTGYEISLWVHISAVVIGLGATFAESIAFPVAMRLDARHLPYVHRLQLAINQYLATPALVVILLTGMYQVSDADLSFGDFWISASFAILVVLGGLLGAYFIPADRRLGPLAQRDIERSGDGQVVLFRRVPARGQDGGDRRHGRRPAGDRRDLPDGHEAGDVSTRRSWRLVASSSPSGAHSSPSSTA